MQIDVTVFHKVLECFQRVKYPSTALMEEHLGVHFDSVVGCLLTRVDVLYYIQDSLNVQTLRHNQKAQVVDEAPLN